MMNLLSVGAALGVTVAIFQWGCFGGVLHISRGASAAVHHGMSSTGRLSAPGPPAGRA